MSVLGYDDAPRPLTDQERHVLQRVFSDYMEVPGEWKTALRNDLESDPPDFVLGGKAGPPGPAGPPGAAGGTYQHVQLSLSVTWSVAHNLGFNPAVTVIDSGGTVLVPDLHYVDANNLTLTFGAATSGKAYCS